MRSYRADLHVHTVLSPCGDLEMSPANIVEASARKGVDILGIADHNSTKHGMLIKKLAEKEGIFVLTGAEVTTKEEIHCLAFFENNDSLEAFQEYLDKHLPDVKNKPDAFGYQVVVDEEEMIVEEVDKLLISALDQSIDQVEKKVHSLGGLFIPAHIDRPSFSLFSQLGFIPPDLKADALEISGKSGGPDKMRAKYPELKKFSIIQSSDAHFPDQVGDTRCYFLLKTRSFAEIRMALKGEEGRKVEVRS
ncbi:MAG: PHP domain-containing protein [Bacteroidales bacterium]